MISLRILSTAAALLALASSGEEICAKTVRGRSFLSRLSPTLGSRKRANVVVEEQKMFDLFRKRANVVVDEQKMFDLGLEQLQEEIDILENGANDDASMYAVAQLRVKLAAEQSRELIVNAFLSRFEKGEMELEAGILAIEKAKQASLEEFALSKHRESQGYFDVYMPYYTEAMRLWGQEQAVDDAFAAKAAREMRRRGAFRQ